MGKTLNSKSLAQIEIPLPPLDEQKRIAYLLGKVEGAIAQRKQHLQQLDNLLKIIFLDLFGFLDDFFKDWDRDKLASHTDVVSGATKGKKYKEANLIEVPYMRVANVQDRYFDLTEIKTISVTLGELEKYRLQKGDLLLTEGGDPDKLGRGSVWENQIDDCIHQNHIFRVRIDNLLELNPYYLSALVSSQYGKAYFLKSAKQTTGIASINSTQLKNFPVLIPPIDLQNKFAEIILEVEDVKSSYQKSLADLENLYGSLSQKAFKGELDLSRVPLALEGIEAVENTNTTYTQQQAADTATLPAPSVLTALTSSKSRNAFIKRWLVVWLDLLNDEPFSSNLFMLATQQRLSELAEDESIEIGIEEYDQLRDWLFYDIQRGQLEQKLNKVIIDDKQESGNRVILNKIIQR